MQVAQQISPSKLDGSLKKSKGNNQLKNLQETLKSKPFIIMNVDPNDRTK